MVPEFRFLCGPLWHPLCSSAVNLIFGQLTAEKTLRTSQRAQRTNLNMRLPKSGDENMTNKLRRTPTFALATFLIACSFVSIVAQQAITIITGAELSRIVPSAFYFQGLSAPTQMRNAAAARFGANRYVVAGLVDTTGYAADVRAKYEGFFITDSPIKINGLELAVGAYGFGFSDDGKLQVLDLAGNQVVSVSTAKDDELKRPRPLMMTTSVDGLRFYSGRDYVTITAK